MALLLPFQSPCVSFKHLQPTTQKHVRFLVSARTSSDPLMVQRRSANYQPNIWDYDFIQSLKSDCMGQMYSERAQELKENVRRMFDETAADPLFHLKLIDTIQRLGVGYQFENEIKGALDTTMSTVKYSDVLQEEDLYATALRFRLLRQHGYNVSQDSFKSFKDKMGGGFKAHISKDIEGMLSLYEASFYALEGEDILDEAQEFTSRHLKEFKGIKNLTLAKKVSHALDLPLHWRMPRLECRWFVDIYKMNDDMDPLLLEFSKLDFNMVQKTHQDDLKYASRWWRELGLAQRLSFARDRLVENFFWALGIIFEPQFGCCRRQITKVTSIAITIDDVYDIYGSLDELLLFTDAVERWDINKMEELPDYMKICFLVLYNTTNEMAYDILKERAWNILPYLKKGWADFCNACLVEAKWYYNGYTPTLEEYLNNSWISIAGHVVLVHAYFLVSQKITKEALDCLENYTDLIRRSCMILRLSDDLGTSKDEIERGDVPKSIQCYMHETGVSEEAAREHIKHLIGETWKKMNKDRVARSPFPQPFINATVDLARMAQCVYQYGDGHGVPDRETKDGVMSLLVEPIPLLEG